MKTSKGVKRKKVLVFFFIFSSFSFLFSQVLFSYGRTHLFPFSHWNFFSTSPGLYQDYSLLIRSKNKQDQIICLFEGCEILQYQKIKRNRYQLYYLIQYLGKKTEGELVQVRAQSELKDQIKLFMKEIPYKKQIYLVRMSYFPHQYLKENRVVKYEILQKI